MFKKIGGLKNYWHIIGLSKELKKSQAIKRKIYGIPVILWRDNHGKINCLIDVCPHKHAPLQVTDFKNNNLTCSYHGWKFSKSGEVINIPSSPDLTKKVKCKGIKLKIEDKYGFLWIYLDGENKKYPEITNILDGINNKWFNYYNSMEFLTTEELLIENFMDSTHTPIVHNKIVRDDKYRTEHKITLKHNNEKVIAEFENREENVGLGINKLFKKKLLISHKDEFILPNLVKIRYKINNIFRFQAFVGCTPISEGKTIAFLRVTYNFGFLNYFLKFLIPIIAKKVLKQDYDISKIQFENLKIFKTLKQNNLSYDSLHNRVKLVRNQIKQGKKISINNTQEIKIKV